MALGIFTDCRLCECIEANPLPLAIRRNRLELTIPEDRDNPVHGIQLRLEATGVFSDCGMWPYAI